MRQIKFIVIHCADTPNDREVTAEEIHQWHLERGWSGIGYNKVIRRSGTIEQGRPDYWQGAHAQDFDGNGEGDNSDSLGVCLVGRDEFTSEQWESLKIVIRQWLNKYPDAQVVGHYQLDNRKSCPNFDVPVWVAENQRGFQL